MPFLSQWEPNNTCYIRTVEGDLVRVKLLRNEKGLPFQWETVPPFKKEQFDAIKDYRYWFLEIPE